MIIETSILVMMLIFVFNFNFKSKFEPINYLINSLQHADFLHLLINSYSLWQLRDFANSLGIQKFLLMMITIWVISSLLLYWIHLLLPITKKTTVGFSAVILGLLLINKYQMNGQLQLVSLDMLAQILPHLFMSDISFLGHLSGILAALIYTRFL